jgi:hypothetical protein
VKNLPASTSESWGEVLVPSIGSISFELEATGGDSDDGGGGRRWRASGSRCSALESQWGSRRASRGRCGAS